jgi:hypothetical protein
MTFPKLIFVPSKAAGPVTFDAKNTSGTTAGSATTLDNGNLTIGSGANRLLVAVLIMSNTAPSSETMVWDPSGANQSLTLIQGFNGGSGRIEFWCLPAPTSGNKILRYTQGGAAGNLILSCISFTGANQVGGSTSCPNATSNTGTGVTSSVTVTCPANGAVVEGTINPSSVTSVSGTGQVEIYKNSALSVVAGGSSYNVGNANPTLSWNITSSSWMSAGVSIAPG